MKIHPLGIEGAFEVEPELRGDSRGQFMEWYRWDALAEAVGHPLKLAQANISISAAGVVRGIHFASVPVGQAKYITCMQGALLDVVVDLRVGSPTFGKWEAVRLNETNRRSVYLAEGLGHGFCALTDNTMIAYMCSAVYNPAAEFVVHPLDPALGIEWPVAQPILSARDETAPTLAEAEQKGILPQFSDCRDYTASLRHGGM
ncbi:DTDP-4-dehydrorhamnose 3,5-epimerase RmlC [Rhizocola hellebori]|uniref:dTDP-4-dehydrorhamnose 3,5-epimerase n=1 Tax=Rhizocola hellebori TaxID=1392758 RepID=A0A8J3QGE7_9ACTN|nr:dTDP-4-dehydrorhamnose 3,5-epimerase [Rhizocola hellebori]GIH09632.1 DTDP-4-dehydrorhamnose 3,5-epimerase RmlC [Rhizocola hellebori]